MPEIVEHGSNFCICLTPPFQNRPCQKRVSTRKSTSVPTFSAHFSARQQENKMRHSKSSQHNPCRQWLMHLSLALFRSVGAISSVPFVRDWMLHANTQHWHTCGTAQLCSAVALGDEKRGTTTQCLLWLERIACGAGKRHRQLCTSFDGAVGHNLILGSMSHPFGLAWHAHVATTTDEGGCAIALMVGWTQQC